MLLSDNSLRTVLSSLSLTSSLFKPMPDFIAGAIDDSPPTIQGAQCIPFLVGFAGDCANVPEALAGIVVATDSASTTTSPSPNTALKVNRTAGPNDPRIRMQDTACVVPPYDSPIIPTPLFPPFDDTRANVYRYRQQQGVNLGSW